MKITALRLVIGGLTAIETIMLMIDQYCLPTNTFGSLPAWVLLVSLAMISSDFLHWACEEGE